MSYQARKLGHSTRSFAQFSHILAESSPLDYDPHWRPTSLLCAICSPLMVEKARIWKVEELSKTFPRLNVMKKRRQRHLEEELREKYRLDLNLLNYTWTE